MYTRELVINFELCLECTGYLRAYPSRVAAREHGLLGRLLLDARQPPAHPTTKVDVGLQGEQLLVVPGTRQRRACPTSRWAHVSAQVSGGKGTHFLHMDGGSIPVDWLLSQLDIGQAHMLPRVHASAPLPMGASTASLGWRRMVLSSVISRVSRWAWPRWSSTASVSGDHHAASATLLHKVTQRDTQAGVRGLEGP